MKRRLRTPIAITGFLLIPFILIGYYLAIESTLYWLFPYIQASDAFFLSVVIMVLVGGGIASYLQA